MTTKKYKFCGSIFIVLVVFMFLNYLGPTTCAHTVSPRVTKFGMIAYLWEERVSRGSTTPLLKGWVQFFRTLTGAQKVWPMVTKYGMIMRLDYERVSRGQPCPLAKGVWPYHPQYFSGPHVPVLKQFHPEWPNSLWEHMGLIIQTVFNN